MNQQTLLYLLIGAGLIWTAVWLFVITSVPRVAPEEEVDRRTATLRTRLVYPLGAVMVVGLALSLYWMPYPIVRGRTIGAPTVTVDATASQWVWTLSEQQLPAQTRVEFDLTSTDVNHSFAIFSPDGVLLTQAQAMPGYTNKLIYQFDQPGTYTVRCLEFCGMWHDVMVAVLTIV